ncbi:MAG TPA: EAL domain-containing protein [Burkholderiales bacterium]|nr:EAL domain-containing protein [Burkholderiales bacterium]
MAATTGTTAALGGAQRDDAPESLEARMQTAERFAEALQQDQFSLFGQPIAPLAAAKSDRRHLEIFVRFREEEEHLLPPGTFLPILAANHLTNQLDRWEVQKVLRWSAEKRKGKADWQIPTFNINLADDTVNDHDFAADVLDSLYESRVPPDRLWFEITVKQLADFREASKRTIADLKGLGCAVAVSDFAGGEAEAREYWNRGIQFVKLAGGVVRDIQRSPRALSTLLAINDACHKFGMKTIAQFVETTEALAMIRRAGVDYAQGFRIAVPVPLTLLN